MVTPRRLPLLRKRQTGYGPHGMSGGKRADGGDDEPEDDDAEVLSEGAPLPTSPLLLPPRSTGSVPAGGYPRRVRVDARRLGSGHIIGVLE